MAEATSPANRIAEIRSLESRAVRAGQNGRDGEAAALWQQLLALEPAHALALTALGQQAFRRGDAARRTRFSPVPRKATAGTSSTGSISPSPARR